MCSTLAAAPRITSTACSFPTGIRSCDSKQADVTTNVRGFAPLGTVNQLLNPSIEKRAAQSAGGGGRLGAQAQSATQLPVEIAAPEGRVAAVGEAEAGLGKT